jgi:hypothetical protein
MNASTATSRPATGQRHLRRGERVVAVAEVTADRITIHGYGTYDHDLHPDPATLVRIEAAIHAADRVTGSHGALLDAACRYMSSERAEETRARFLGNERKRRATPPAHRARKLAESIHHGRRVRLDAGGVIDAGACSVMPLETFATYAKGLRISLLPLVR